MILRHVSISVQRTLPPAAHRVRQPRSLFRTCAASRDQYDRRQESDVATPTTATAAAEERNIFAEAEEEDALDAKRVAARDSLLQRQRDAMAREPVWDGDERVQDTILRMLMDKHQPLRIKGQHAAGQHPADAKLASIQKPISIATPTMGKAAPDAAIADVDEITAAVAGVAARPKGNPEEDRRLAKTPADKPWRAVYVNPLRTTPDGQDREASIHYAKYIGLPPTRSGSRPVSRTATGKERLRMAGIKTETLPFDDRNKMRAIREGVRRWDRAGRMRGVKEEAMQYRRMREDERVRGGNSSTSGVGDEDELMMTDEEVDAMLNAEGILKEGEEMHLSSSSGSKPGEVQVGMSGGRGFTSIANERIEAAMKTDYFRRNSLRGKPLVKDLHASNPFLNGEERIMNRLIQRQGAAPPWVELNVQLENEQADFRKRLADSWLRRASRMILASSHLRAGLQPIPSSADSSGQPAPFDALEKQINALTAGQQSLLALVKSYTDDEWEARERSYHDVSLRDINNTLRRYNVVAPASARRGLLTREAELIRMREECRSALVQRLSDGLSPSSSSFSPPSSTSSSSKAGSSWFRVAPSTSTLPNGAPSQMPATGAGRAVYGDHDGRNDSGDEGGAFGQHARSPQQSKSSLIELMRRTAQKARQLVSW